MSSVFESIIKDSGLLLGLLIIQNNSALYALSE